MKYFIYIIIGCFFFSAQTFSIAPPKAGVKVPEYLKEEFKQIQSEYSSGYWAQEMARRRTQRENSNGEFSTASAPTDTVRIPIIFGGFLDLQTRYSSAQLQAQLYDGPNPTGTITQFYLDNSYGKMYVTGAVGGDNNAPNVVSYYAGTDGKSSNGRRDFTIDILMEADKKFDFSPFIDRTSNTDGYYHVRFIAVIHAGAGAEAGASNIWAHKWNIRARLITRKADPNETYIDKSRVIKIGSTDGYYLTNDYFNGVPIVVDGEYSCEPELAGSNNANGPIIQIGVFCHEYGHIFGLSDFYDTDNSSSGLGNWCLMASGSWGGDGGSPDLPCHMSAWCKIQMGWLTPKNISSFSPHQPIREIETSPEAYRLWSLGASGLQYFLVENRQKKGFDKNLLNSGLLIYHIDEAQKDNTDENHYKVDLEQADGMRSLNLGSTNRGDAGDPFPGGYNNRRFDGYSVPNSKNYANGQSYVGIRNISSSSDTMYADLDIGTRPYIVLNNAKLVEGASGNGNGRIDAGETGSISVSAENIYPTATDQNAVIRFSTTAKDVTIDASSKPITLKGLTSFNDVINTTVTASTTSQNRIIPLTVQVVTAAEVFSNTFEVVLGYPKLVIVDLDTVASENIQSKYRTVIEKIGKNYEVVSSLGSSLDQMKLGYRSNIVLCSGRKKFNIISDSLALQLLSFLNSGGNVFLSGQNIAEDIFTRNSAVGRNLIHAGWTKNIVFGKIPIGIANDMLGSVIPKINLAGGDAIANQTSPDEITVDSIANPMFRWNTTTGTNYAGLWYANTEKKSKLVFWSFGLEGANDSIAGVTTKSAALQSVFNWFDGSTSTPEYKASTVPIEFALGQNYPNPFNPSTILEYSVPVRGLVRIDIFDILGKKIATVVNDMQEAGTHRATWLGKDSDGNSVASGMYLYHMRSGSFDQVKKMMLMK